MPETESSQLDGLGQYLPKMHSLVPAETSTISCNTLDLFSGENWLILRVSADGSLESPLIYSTEKNQGVTPRGSPCGSKFIVIDVDGILASVKDMRQLSDSFGEELDISIARDGKDSPIITDSMEKLERRRLVHLSHKDHIVINHSQGDSAAKIIFQYRHEHAIMTNMETAASATLTEQTSGSVNFCTAREEETAEQTDVAPLDDAKSKVSKDTTKSIAAEQLVTQPEYSNQDKDAEMLDAQAQSDPNDDLLASQPAMEIEHAPEKAESDHQFSDDETVDPDEDKQETSNGDNVERLEESEATSLFSPPPETMGETQPIVPPPPLPFQEQDSADRLTYVDEADDSSTDSELTSHHLPSTRARHKLLGVTMKIKTPQSAGLKSPGSKLSHLTSPAPSVDPDAETEDEADVVKETSAPLEEKGRSAAGAQNPSPSERAACDGDAHIKTRNLEETIGDDKAQPNRGNRAESTPNDTGSKAHVSLVEALIESTKAPTPRVGTFEYDYGASFDDDDSNDAPHQQRSQAANEGDKMEIGTTVPVQSDAVEQVVKTTDPSDNVDMVTTASTLSDVVLRSDAHIEDNAGATVDEKLPEDEATVEKSQSAKPSRARSAKTGAKPKGRAEKKPLSRSTQRARATRMPDASTISSKANIPEGEEDEGMEETLEEDAKSEDLSPDKLASSRRPTKKTPVDASATPPSAATTRKRQSSAQDTPIAMSSRKKTKRSEGIRILTTKLQLEEKEKKLIHKIPGAKWVETTEEAHLATHVIAKKGKDPLKRTPKLMIAMNKTPNIVTLDWLIESAKKGTALPCDRYLVKDKAAEKTYKFRMAETVERIKDHIEHGTAVLSGKSVFVCKGVAGDNAPKEDELRCIVEAAGGSWLSTLEKATAKPTEDLIIITSKDQPVASKQIKERAVAGAIKKGALQKTTTWLFDGIMAQQLDF